MYAPGDVRVEERPDPAITAPADAVIRLVATCVCGSDLWAWRGTDPVTQLTMLVKTQPNGCSTGRGYWTASSRAPPGPRTLL
jgi:NADPH:quinone reductase-like Zn-dependent oxidoreductase